MSLQNKDKLKCIFFKASVFNDNKFHFYFVVKTMPIESKQEPKKVAFIGDIGSGKTTTLKELLKRIPRSGGTLEPVDRWEKDQILEKYYKNKQKLSLSMQVYAFATRMIGLKRDFDKFNGDIFFMDGHVIMDKWMYKQALIDEKNISEVEDSMYKQIYKQWKELVTEHRVDTFVILDTPPEVCMQRIKNRNRPEECKISIEYLQCLYDKLMILKDKLIKSGRKVIVVDGTQPLDDVVNTIIEALDMGQS
jgi:deoxyadenosine/deoxycytidine kinase